MCACNVEETHSSTFIFLLDTEKTIRNMDYNLKISYLQDFHNHM